MTGTCPVMTGLSKVASCWQKSSPTWLVSAGYTVRHFFTDGIFYLKYPWTGCFLWQLSHLLQNFLLTLNNPRNHCRTQFGCSPLLVSPSCEVFDVAVQIDNYNWQNFKAKFTKFYGNYNSIPKPLFHTCNCVAVLLLFASCIFRICPAWPKGHGNVCYAG